MIRNMCVVLSQVCAAGQQSGSSSCLLFFFSQKFCATACGARAPVETPAHQTLRVLMQLQLETTPQ